MKTTPLADDTLPVGLIGLGSMGSFVAREIMKGEIPGIRLVVAADIRPPSPDLLQELREHSVSLVQSFESLGSFPIRLVIECANQKVVTGMRRFLPDQRSRPSAHECGGPDPGFPLFPADRQSRGEGMPHLSSLRGHRRHRCFAGGEAPGAGRSHPYDSKTSSKPWVKLRE